MSKRISLLATVLIIFVFSASAQIREIPKEIRETFFNQYPKAENTEIKDQLLQVKVHFTMEGEKYIATYNNKGEWKESEKETNFEKLSEVVKDGFNKSKFANKEWKVVESKVIFLPDGDEQTRIKVVKNDLQKKYLYFNKDGRLLRETITL
jgi:hypothetical protein